MIEYVGPTVIPKPEAPFGVSRYIRNFALYSLNFIAISNPWSGSYKPVGWEHKKSRMLYHLQGIDICNSGEIYHCSVVNSVDHFQMSCGTWKEPMLCPGSYLWSCNQVSLY